MCNAARSRQSSTAYSRLEMKNMADAYRGVKCNAYLSQRTVVNACMLPSGFLIIGNHSWTIVLLIHNFIPVGNDILDVL